MGFFKSLVVKKGTAKKYPHSWLRDLRCAKASCYFAKRFSTGRKDVPY